MKNTKKIALLLGLLLSPVIFVCCSWIITLGGMYIVTPMPPKPEIQTGEFPFELTYKLNGELYTVTDTYICNYDGIGFNEGYGKYRKWSGYIKDTGETAVLITEDADRQIFCFVGNAEFYMNDEMYPEERPLTPRLYDVKKDPDADALSTYRIMVNYDIEIVSWSFSEPVENSFE